MTNEEKKAKKEFRKEQTNKVIFEILKDNQYYNMTVKDVIENNSCIDIDSYIKQMKAHYIIEHLRNDFDVDRFYFDEVYTIEISDNTIDLVVDYIENDNPDDNHLLYVYEISFDLSLEDMEIQADKFMTELENYFDDGYLKGDN